MGKTQVKVKTEKEETPVPESKDESMESSEEDENQEEEDDDESQEEEEDQQKGEQRDSILLGFFWDLASADIATRNKSVHGLLEYLITKQKEYEENFANEAEKSSPQLRYASQRLAKGVSSSREGARQGFSTALCEVLKQFPTLDVSSILKKLEEHTQVSRSTSGQESRDNYFGRVIGILSVILSGRLDNCSNADLMVDLVEKLLKTSGKRVYLREISFQILVTLLQRCVTPEIFQEKIVPILQPYINVKMGELHCDSLNLIYEVKKKFGYDVTTEWKRRITHIKHLPQLVEILKSTTFNHPRVHNVWNHVIADFRDNTSSRKKASFEEFWTAAVDEGLCTSTPERKYLAFQLFDRIFATLNTDEVSTVFSKNFTQLLSASESTKILKSSSKAALDKIKEVSENNDSLRVPILIAILSRNRNFDKVTKSETISHLVSKMNAEGISEFLTYLENSFYSVSIEKNQKNEEEDSKQEESDSKNKSIEDKPAVGEHRRISLIDQMISLVKQKGINRDESWILRIFKFLIFNGFLKSPTEEVKNNKVLDFEIRIPSPPVSEFIRKQVHSKFFSLLVELNNSNFYGDKDEKHRGRMKEGNYFILYALEFIKNAQSLKIQPAYEIDEDIFKKSIDFIKQVQSKVSEAKDNKEALKKTSIALLVGVLTIHLFVAEDDAGEIAGVIEDVKTIYSELFETKTNKKTKKKSEEEETEKPLPMDVLCDVALTLLSRGISYLRDAINFAFRAFADQVTESSLKILLDMVVEKPSEGEEGEDGEDMEDVSDEEHSHSHSEDEDEALLEAGPESEEEEEGEGEEEGESSDEEELGDEQMEKFDEKLSEILKEMKAKGKKGKRDFKQKTIQIKFRVLELFEILFEKAPSNKVIIQAILPLINTITAFSISDTNLPYLKKITSLLANKLPKTKEVPKEVNASEVNEMIQKMFSILLGKLSRKKEKREMLVKISSSLIHYLIKVITHSDESLLNKKDIISNFEKTLQLFSQNRDFPLSVTAIEEFYNRHPFIASSTHEALVEAVQNGRNDFSKTKAFSLLVSAFRKVASNNPETIKSWIPSTQKLFKTLVSSNIAPKYLREILSSFNSLLQTTKKISDLKDSWNMADVGKSLEEIQGNKTYSDVGAIKQLCSAISNKGAIVKTDKKRKEPAKASTNTPKKGKESKVEKPNKKKPKTEKKMEE